MHADVHGNGNQGTGPEYTAYSNDEGFPLRDIYANGTRAFVDIMLDPDEDDNMFLYVCLNEVHQMAGLKIGGTLSCPPNQTCSRTRMGLLHPR